MGSDVRLPCAEEEEEEEEAEAGQTFGLGHARLLLRRTMAEYIPLSPHTHHTHSCKYSDV